MADERVVVVTGGSSGIGAAVVSQFTNDGWHAAIVDLQEPLNTSAAPFLWLEADVGNEASVAEVFEAVVEKTARIDALVTCAGIDVRSSLTESSVELWNRVMRINATGTFLCVRAAARVMTVQRAGSIVCISSINAQLGLPLRSAYSASKGAVESFVRAAAAELGRDGVRVNAVAPGAIETPMWGEVTDEDRNAKGDRAALGYVGAPSDIAAAARYLCSDAARYVTGIVLPVCGGRAGIDYLPPAR